MSTPAKIFDMSGAAIADTGAAEPPAVAKGGRPPYDGDMEPRLVKLEEFAVDAKDRLVKIETRLDQTATKTDIEAVRTDLHKMHAEIKTWTLATMITIIGTMLAAIFGISQIFKTTSAPPASGQLQPIIIYAQPPAAVVPQPPPTPPSAKP